MKNKHELAQENFLNEISSDHQDIDNGLFYDYLISLTLIIWALTLIGSIAFYG